MQKDFIEFLWNIHMLKQALKTKETKTKIPTKIPKKIPQRYALA